MYSIISLYLNTFILKLVFLRKSWIARSFKISKLVKNVKKDSTYKRMNVKQILKISYQIVKDMKILINVLNVHMVTL